jgi:hypothetical protein
MVAVLRVSALVCVCRAGKASGTIKANEFTGAALLTFFTSSFAFRPIIQGLGSSTAADA